MEDASWTANIREQRIAPRSNKQYFSSWKRFYVYLKERYPSSVNLALDMEGEANRNNIKNCIHLPVNNVVVDFYLAHISVDPKTGAMRSMSTIEGFWNSYAYFHKDNKIENSC